MTERLHDEYADLQTLFCGESEADHKDVYRVAVAVLEELEQLRAEADMPCYLCAVPGKNERARTSICTQCGEQLRVENERLKEALAGNLPYRCNSYPSCTCAAYEACLILDEDPEP